MKLVRMCFSLVALGLVQGCELLLHGYHSRIYQTTKVDGTDCSVETSWEVPTEHRDVGVDSGGGEPHH